MISWSELERLIAVLDEGGQTTRLIRDFPHITPLVNLGNCTGKFHDTFPGGLFIDTFGLRSPP